MKAQIRENWGTCIMEVKGGELEGGDGGERCGACKCCNHCMISLGRAEELVKHFCLKLRCFTATE